MGSKQETPEKKVSKHFLSGKRVRSFKSTVYRPFRRRNGVKRSTFCTREKCHLIKFERRTENSFLKRKKLPLQARELNDRPTHRLWVVGEILCRSQEQKSWFLKKKLKKKNCPSRVRVPRNNLSELGQFTPSIHNLCWGFIHGTYEVEATTNVNPKTKLKRARKDEPGTWYIFFVRFF